MTDRVTGYFSSELHEEIKTFADHHDISKSKALSILVGRGLGSWESTVRQIRLEAKLDVLIEAFAEQKLAKEKIKERFENEPTAVLADGEIVELADEPNPLFNSNVIQPDEWEDVDLSE